MLFIPKFNDYLKIWTDEKVRNFVVIDFSDIIHLFDPELQLINTKAAIKNKLKELLSKLKKYKVQAILNLDYKKWNNRKIFHSSVKVIANNSDINEAFKSMHKTNPWKNKNLCF